jgi:hypothetical protein
MNEDSINNPFRKALEGFKANKVLVPEPVATSVPENEIIHKPTEIKSAEKESEQEWRDPETGLLKEDQNMFESLCKLIGLKRKDKYSENRYWRVRDCFRDSYNYDMSYEINRSFWHASNMLRSEVEKIKSILLKRGYEASAVKWLLSRTPEAMRYGNGSRELRLEKAKESAIKAGKTIEEIAKTHGLENLLK